MAALLLNPTLSKSKFLNWIKAALAVLFTKEEIEPVVYNEIQQFQQKCLQDIVNANSLQAGSTCSNCCTENVVVCPTDRICNVNRGKCKYHRNATRKYRPSGCPNSICHHLKSEIQAAHRYNGPSYRNTDATQWCSNPWEIAKCFMPPDGYENVHSASETDFNGIISIIINHKDFDATITDDLSKRGNIFDKGRDVGKAVRHSPNLEVDDADLTQYFADLNNMLNDAGFISLNKTSHNGCQKLAKLQSGNLVIGKDIVTIVLDDAAKAIQERIRNETDEFKIETEKQKLSLIDTVDNKIKGIEEQGNMSVTKLNEALKSAVDAFEKMVLESSKKIEQQLRGGKQTLEVAAVKGVKDINEARQEAIQEIKEEKENKAGISIETEEEKYQKLKNQQSNQEKKHTTSIWQRIWWRKVTYPRQKKELKKQLIKYYKNKQSTVPLSPLVEEKDTPLAGFYVMPDMVLVKQKSETCDQEERIPINSFRDLFITGSENQQEIYVSADAGFGKTSFSKYLAITWSQACSPDSNKDCFKDKELKALAKFEFVFLVLLRESTTVCTIDEMIEQQIIKKLPRSASQCPLQDILEKEKCLIILDGLDEWTHPDSCFDQKEKNPHRYTCGDNCVILTTTRPWKLGVSSLKTSDINQKVELVKLSKDSTIQLEKNAIRKMSNVNDKHVLEEKTRAFKKDINGRGLENMQTIPLLLMYITCLWCNKIPIGNSKVEVYINIIEFLLSRTAQKHPDVHPSSETSHGDIPECLKNHKFCQKFYSFLLVLAELAYNTLFNENRENKLVFDQCVAEIYLKADDMKLSLLSGILTGSTTANLVERTTKVSFSHKTVQELFAAIYISSHSDGQKTLVEKCTNVQSILDMSMIYEFLSITNYEMIDEILAVCKTEFDKCRTVQSILNMSTICEFLSRVNSKMMCEISTGLMSVINEDEGTCNYRTQVTDMNMYYRNVPLYNIQKMFVSCLKQMPESENIKLCLQDFFIDEDTMDDEHLQRLSKQNQTSMKSLYIDISRTNSSLGDVITLFSLTDLSNLQTLHYHGARNNKEAELSLLLSENLQYVELWFAESTNYEGNLCDRITALKHVQYLHIRNVKLSHETRSILYDFISNNKTIKQLKLENLDCKEHGDRHHCTGNFDLSIKHSQLEKLELWVLPSLNLTVTSQSLVDVKLWLINLGESSLFLSRDMINIKRVELLCIKISAKRFRDFINVVEELPQSVTVKMYKCDIEPYTEYERVRNDIRSPQKFVVTQNRKDKYGYQEFEFQTTTSCDM